MTKAQENRMVYLTSVYKPELVRDYINNDYYEWARNMCNVVYDLYQSTDMTTRVALTYFDIIVQMCEADNVHEGFETDLRKWYGEDKWYKEMEL